MTEDPTPGIYRHFKGGIVQVLYIVTHTETLEQQVIYRSLYACRTGGKGSMWVRPEQMFRGWTVHEGRMVKRFTRIAPSWLKPLFNMKIGPQIFFLARDFYRGYLAADKWVWR